MGEQVKRYRLDCDEMLVDARNGVHPFKQGFIIYNKRYVVGTDFTSGDNLRIDIDGAQSISFAAAKTPSGTLLTIAETDLATETGDTSRQGISLTTGTSTTDIQVLIVAAV